MKNKIKTLLLTGCVSLALGTSLSSCQDYLDKEARLNSFCRRCLCQFP